MTKREIKLREARGLIWRNITEFPTTFGNCATPGCDGHGRGGGQCVTCAEKALAKVIGPGGDQLAEDYAEAVRQFRSAKTVGEKKSVRQLLDTLESAMSVRLTKKEAKAAAAIGG